MITLRYLTILLCAGIGFGYTGGGVGASEPSIYSKILTPSPLGKDRVLVLCVPEKSNNGKLTQFYNSVMWDEFYARHLTVVEVSQRAVQSVIPNEHGVVKGVAEKSRHQDFGDKIRRKAECNKDLEFVLIGKDTGVKKRWDRFLPQDELFQLIDAMPMRRFEMRQQKEKN